MANSFLPVGRSITAQNQLTDWLILAAGQQFLVQVASTSFSATITLRYRADASSPVTVIETYTADVVKNGVLHAAGEVQIGCLTGNFSSATALTVAIYPGARHD